MKHLITFSLLLFTLVSFSQDKKIFYDSDWEVCNETQAHYYRIITYDANTNTKGAFKDYYITGEVQMKGYFSHIDHQDETKNIKDGEVIIYYKNGQENKVYFVEDGLANGDYKEYHENGVLATTGSVKNGKDVGVWSFYNDDGDFEKKKTYSLEGAEYDYWTKACARFYKSPNEKDVIWFKDRINRESKGPILLKDFMNSIARLDEIDAVEYKSIVKSFKEIDNQYDPLIEPLKRKRKYHKQQFDKYNDGYSKQLAEEHRLKMLVYNDRILALLKEVVKKQDAYKGQIAELDAEIESLKNRKKKLFQEIKNYL